MIQNYVVLLIALICISTIQAVIQNRCKAKGVVAISLDFGPNEQTDGLLVILKDLNVKVTFHITTQYLTNPNAQAVIKRISADGHLIGLCTDPSWDLFKMTDEEIRTAIELQSQAMKQLIGYKPIFIRLPYKKFDERILHAVESNGSIVTTDNLNCYDYRNESATILKAYQISLSLSGPGFGSFISAHNETIAASVQSFPRVIDLIQSLGYRIIKLDECLGLDDLTITA